MYFPTSKSLMIMVKKLIKYFFVGLSIVLPFFALAYLLYFLYTELAEYVNLDSSAILILPIVIGLIAIGYARTFFDFKLFLTFESYLMKTPIIGSLYKSIKEVTRAFVGAENKFSEPVLVLFAGDIYKIGFITNKENEYLVNDNYKDDEILFSVYFPLSFSLSGDLFIVPKDRIKPIDKSANEVMQMIVSGGLIKGIDKPNGHKKSPTT